MAHGLLQREEQEAAKGVVVGAIVIYPAVGVELGVDVVSGLQPQHRSVGGTVLKVVPHYVRGVRHQLAILHQ